MTGGTGRKPEKDQVKQFDLLKQATCQRASGCARAILLPQRSHMSEV
jgi:hypothetical protein